MITLTLLLVFYVASAIVAYRSIKRKYSPGGDWQYISPNIMDACIVFIPIANFFICLLELIEYLIETDSRSFFRIDEEEIDEEEEINEEEELRKETEAYNKWKSAHDRRRKKLQKN